ncbi:hypothetical protein C8J57DRAFT_1248032 [Mycena rebaudengoi]|nr:hypothetical protein C8J57DRAFT_1248032 [Mycena rebaudengoi]
MIVEPDQLRHYLISRQNPDQAKMKSHEEAPAWEYYLLLLPHPLPLSLKKAWRLQSEVHNGEVVDPISDGPGSSDDYVPPAGELHENTNVEEDTFNPLEDDEPVVTSKPRKKKEPKGSLRQAVKDEHLKLAGQASKENSKGKRKDPPLTIAHRAPKKSKQPAVGGLHDGWEHGRAAASASASQRSKSAGSAMSVDGFSEDGAAFPPASEYNSSEGMGGISDNPDAGDKAQWATDNATQKVGRGLENLSKVKSLAGIVDTKAEGLVPLHRSNASTTLKRSKINLSNLPDDIRNLFSIKFRPILLECAGRLKAWETPDGFELAELWDPTFPKHPLTGNPELQLIVSKLSDDKLNGWRHKFATAAVEALTSCLESWEYESADEQAEGVKYLLQGDSDRSRVFYYRSYFDDLPPDSPEDAVPAVNPKGIFQGVLIAAMLAAHYTAIHGAHAKARQNPKDPQYPIGALVYSIQAVKRALNYSQTGKFTPPPGRLGEFSKTNWGDKMELREGRQVMVNTTSSLDVIVGKLMPSHWEKIITAALDACQTT